MIQKILAPIGVFIFVTLIIAFIILPIAAVAIVSFGESPFLVFPPTALTGRWYAEIFTRPEWISSISASIQLAAVVTVLSLIIGSLTAISLHQNQFPGREALTALFLSPLLIPGILIGISLLTLSALVGLRGRYELLVAGHIVVTIPYVIRMVLASLPGAAQSLQEAALTLGADHLTAMLRITVPLIRPGLISGGIFAFITSFDNVSISLFLTRPATITLPVRILSALGYSWDPSIAAVSTFSVLMGLALMLLLARTAGLNMWISHRAIEAQ